ncbi:MAG: hypothetical protein SGI84_10265 [Gemmatimonadota bacterium]|nr:hypothetical protein [Gemmatimonadota bacterium]
MPARAIEVDGSRWTVAPSGRRTQYNRDEYSLVFTRGSGADREQRVMRYSPQGTTNHELSLSRIPDDELRDLLERAQPAWTTPDLGYRR